MAVDLSEIVKLKNLKTLGRKLKMKLRVRSRFHTSNKPVQELKNEPIEEQGLADFKPNGLWYSLGDSWIRFLEQEAKYWAWAAQRLDAFKYLYRLKVDSRRLLVLKTEKDFADFTNRFGLVLPSRGCDVNYLINWQEVYIYWYGIEIRGCEDWMNKYLWFDGWDCASGCIWDMSPIKKIELIHKF